MKAEWNIIKEVGLPKDDEDKLVKFPSLFDGFSMTVANYEHGDWYDYKGVKVETIFKIYAWAELPE